LSVERREPKRAAGELMKLGTDRFLCRREDRRHCHPAFANVKDKSDFPQGGMAVPEGLHQFKQFNSLRWLT
jgi:hypothetical protein